MTARDIELRAQLFALILIVDAEGDADTGSDRIEVEWIVKRRIMGPPPAECRIGGTVRYGKPVIGFRFVDGFERSSEVGPRLERRRAEFFERQQLVG